MYSGCRDTGVPTAQVWLWREWGAAVIWHSMAQVGQSRGVVRAGVGPLWSLVPSPEGREIPCYLFCGMNKTMEVTVGENQVIWSAGEEEHKRSMCA